MKISITKILLLLSIAVLFLTACGQSQDVATNTSVASDNITLNIAYQYGLSYAPLIVCKEQRLIEDAYYHQTGKTLTINWSQMSSGADINSAFASGDLDIACLGIAPAITGISNNIGYKIFTNISGQEHGLMSNDPAITSLSDYIDSNNQIALVNIGSIQHIILGMALAENGYDAHVLDSNIVAMKHPDGMVSLESGSISSHLTSNPYIFKERTNTNLHELDEVKNAWSLDNSFIVGIASENIHTNSELYTIVCNSFSQAIDLINTNPEKVASITSELNGNTYEEELQYIKAGSYSASTSNVLNLASFMFNNQFITREFNAFSELAYDNVLGD